MQKKVYIYGLFDPRNDQIRYVGKTVNLEERLRSHIDEAIRAEEIYNPYKERWIRQLIKLDLLPQIKILEECTENNWAEKEKYWIKNCKNLGCKLTNLTDGGEGFTGNHSEETKQKMSDTRKTMPHGGIPDSWVNRAGIPQSEEHVKSRVQSRKRNNSYNHSQETKDKISKTKKGTNTGIDSHFYGKKHSEESKRKMSESSKGQVAWNVGIPHTEEAKEKNRQAHLGKKHSAETKKKMSEAGKGRIVSDETKAKLRKANTGKKHSEATKEKLRQASLGNTHSDETKEKLRQLNLGKIVSQETRDKMSKSIKGLKRTDEQKKAMSERRKQQWADPVYRAKMLAAQKKRREKESLKKNGNI